MTTSLVTDQPYKWRGERDNEGHRTYYCSWKVKVEAGDGPANIINTSGLPAPGSPWSFGSDVDADAWCYPEMKVRPLGSSKDGFWPVYEVQQKFSTLPLETCWDGAFTDPLLEPQKVSGSYLKRKELIKYNYDGSLAVNSSHQQLTGSNAEFDRAHPAVHIEQNVLDLELPLVATIMELYPLNDAPMWGVESRCVKLSNFSWSKKYRGYCYEYYTRVFDFEVNYNTFDRTIADRGTRALNGHYDPTTGIYTLVNINGAPPDPTDPTHFCLIQDHKGDPIGELFLKEGIPVTDPSDPDNIGTNLLQFYGECNLLLLGVPLFF